MFGKEPENQNMAGGQTSILAQGCKFDGKIEVRGTLRIEGEFSKGDIVLVVDEKHRKPLALGEILYNAKNAKNIKQGVVVKNLHFVSDKIWNFAKALTE